MKKTMMVAAALVAVVALGGCGSQKQAPPPMLSTSFVDTVSVQEQIDSGMAEQLLSETGYTYTVSSSCVAATDTTFTCFADVENDDDPADYTQVSVDVTCDQGGANCIWRTV